MVDPRGQVRSSFPHSLSGARLPPVPSVARLIKQTLNFLTTRIRSILGNPVEGIDNLRIGLCRECERSSVAMESDDQHAFGVSG